MWFLEHESLFGGKRIWLRPGSQQLFGRTKHSDAGHPEGKNVFIDNKNVSRKHMMIEVGEVAPGDGVHLHKRSQVDITDLSCRQGTTIDNNMHKSRKESDGTIAYDKTTLTGKEHIIKLSNSYPPFKIMWQDIVFTFAAKEKKNDATKDMRCAQLHAIDIKTSSEFVYERTTHVVSQKRNLPKVLQALVSGTPIVTMEYLDMVLEAAASSVDVNGAYVPSHLEEDFDTWWPKEKEYIPPAGAEPVARPEQMLEPDTARFELFSGLTFVFVEENQYANLHQVIAGAGGKALFYELRLGETTAAEYVEYVNNVLARKKSRATTAALPVITICPSAYPDEYSEWAISFILKVDQLLAQRSIQQNEFLDAIIAKDRSQLQRPPMEAVDVEPSVEPPSTQTQPPQQNPVATRSQPTVPSPNNEASSTPEEQVKPISRKRPFRRNLTSKFSGFDDGFEGPRKVRKTDDTAMEDIRESLPVQEPSPPSAPASQAVSQPRRSARSQNVTNTVERAEQTEQRFPAAAALKRRREATRGTATSVEPENVQPSRTTTTKSKAVDLVEKMQKSKKKADKDINIREETRKRVIEDEEKRRAQEESLAEALEGVDISEIRGKIQLKEMTVRVPEDRPSVLNQLRSDRWDPAWNGRKNFKKFRRRGVDRGPQSQKVLVSFQEVSQKKVFGGAVLNLDDARSSFTRTQGDHSMRNSGVVRVEESDSEPEAGFTRRKRDTKGTKYSDVIYVEDSGSENEEPPAPSRGSGRVAETQLDQTQTQRGRKRGPVSIAAGQPTFKRSKMTVKDDDSDEEETGFRFRKRG